MNIVVFMLMLISLRKNNKFNICIARVPYGNAHPRITIIQIKITGKFTIVENNSVEVIMQKSI